MKPPQLPGIDTPPRSRVRRKHSGLPSWVVTWGTRLALVNAADVDDARARVRERSRVPIDDDEITVRPATKADGRLAAEFDFSGSKIRRLDWLYGLR